MTLSAFADLLVKYWVLILFLLGAIAFILRYGYKSTKWCINIIREINKVKKIEADVEATKKDTTFIKGKVTTIEKLLTSMFSGTQLAGKFGVAKSPIVLKDDLKKFITDPKIDEQVKSKEKELIDWLKTQIPKTGLDAQDDIAQLVISNKIADYLDLTNYRQNLYKNGKTSEDAVGILVVYLFQELIPKLGLPDKDEKEKLVSKG